MAQESQSSVETSYQTEGYWCSRSVYSRRRSAGSRLPSKVCNSGRASRTGNQKYNVRTGRGQRRSRALIICQKAQRHSSLPSDQEQEVPCFPSEREFEQQQDINQAHAGACFITSPILLMFQVYCLSKVLTTVATKLTSTLIDVVTRGVTGAMRIIGEEYFKLVHGPARYRRGPSNGLFKFIIFWQFSCLRATSYHKQ